MSLFDLTGKVAVITGSTRGIGFAIARQMGLAGAHIIVSSESASDVEAAVAALLAEGLAVSGLRCDVTQVDDLAALVDHALALGGLDALVCNAGITGGAGGSLAR